MTGTELGHGFRLVEHARVGSPHDLARDLAQRGEPEGLFVRADRQTSGRGRLGRSWESPPGNLHASLILRPARPPAEVATLSLVIALALAQAVERLSEGRVRPQLKWPNDVQVAGAKLAGILLEMGADGRGGCAWLVAGIGVNVAWAPGDAVPYRTTSLAAEGLRATPRQVLDGLAASLRPQLERWQAGGFAAARVDWLASAAGLGRPVELRQGEGPVSGILRDVDRSGALCLELASGELTRFSAGEVVLA